MKSVSVNFYGENLSCKPCNGQLSESATIQEVFALAKKLNSWAASVDISLRCQNGKEEFNISLIQKDILSITATEMATKHSYGTPFLEISDEIGNPFKRYFKRR